MASIADQREHHLVEAHARLLMYFLPRKNAPRTYANVTQPSAALVETSAFFDFDVQVVFVCVCASICVCVRLCA